MGWIIPYFNRDVTELRAYMNERLQEERLQKRLVLVIVSIALLLDNMLYMVIVPIVPMYLEKIGAYDKIYTCIINDTKHVFNAEENPAKMTQYARFLTNEKYCHKQLAEEDESLGYLFASKAILQLIVNPFSGTLIDRIGYEIPMMIGLIVMFLSTTVFAVGNSYGILFFARSIQGLGSAFADTSGLAMIADRFTEEHERTKALGLAIAFISFGSLVAPPFGGLLYQTMGKPVPFFILAAVCLADAIMVFVVIHPKVRKTESGERLQGTPIWRLFMDPYIAICSGALIMANVSLAFLEPTIGKWMQDEMEVGTFKQGIIWFPAFFPHLAGVYFTIWLMQKYPQYPWALAMAGLCMEGVSCLMLPFCKQYLLLILPLSFLCFGIALMDTAILPLLGFLVDTRHVSVYGSIYAIADISYSLAYALGPIIAGQVVANHGFKALNAGICFTNLVYSPILYLMRKVYHYTPVEGGEGGEEGKQELDDVNTGGRGYGALEGNGEVTTNADGGVEYKDTLYNRKMKNKPKYRGFKDTDAILADDEDEEYDETAGSGGGAGLGYQTGMGGDPYGGGPPQGGVYGQDAGW